MNSCNQLNGLQAMATRLKKLSLILIFSLPSTSCQISASLISFRAGAMIVAECVNGISAGTGRAFLFSSRSQLTEAPPVVSAVKGSYIVEAHYGDKPVSPSLLNAPSGTT